MSDRKPHQRLPVLVMLSILGLMSFSVFAQEEITARGKQQPVDQYQVEEGQIETTISYPAKVRSLHTVDIVCLVSGTLIELNVKEGQIVKKGELLARVDPADYENNLLVAKARNREATLSYERLSELQKSNVVTQAKLDQAKSALDVSRANLQMAQKALNDTKLYAPFDGQIARRLIERFSFVSAGKPLFTLLDNSRVEFVVQIPEAMMLKGIESISRNAKVYLDAMPERQFELTLSEFQTRADPYTQTYGVIFVMPQPENLNILPGMTATVLLKPESKTEKTVKVPLSSVFSDYTLKKYVWLIGDDQRVRKQEVDVAAIHGDKMYLRSGINPGVSIVKSGVHFLREGDLVKILN